MLVECSCSHLTQYPSLGYNIYVCAAALPCDSSVLGAPPRLKPTQAWTVTVPGSFCSPVPRACLYTARIAYGDFYCVNLGENCFVLKGL